MSDRKRLVVALVAAVIPWSATTAVAAGATPEVPIQFFSPLLARRPANIVLATITPPALAGTGTFKRPGSIKWKTWTPTSATGVGAEFLDPCRPSCAEDDYAKFPVTIRFSDPGRLAGHLVFRRLSLAFTGRRPPKGTPTRLTVGVRDDKFEYQP